MTFDTKTIKELNKMGYRDSFGTALLAAGEADERVAVLAADLAGACRLAPFAEKFPERYFQMGIAEQNMIGVAAGLAMGGLVPVATTFASFAAMRCCEQARTDLAYPHLNAKVLGIDSGVAVGTLGASHYAIEDVAIYRSMPGMVVLCPANGHETAKAVLAMFRHEGPVYLRLPGGKNLPNIYEEDYDFQIGRAETVREGDDVAIFATGLMVGRALEAAALLEKRGAGARVVNVHTLKPLDEAAVRKAAGQVRLIATVEEHSPIGGLGSAVGGVLAALGAHPPLVAISLPDAYAPIGSHDEILAAQGLTSRSIDEKIADAWENVNTLS